MNWKESDIVNQGWKMEGSQITGKDPTKTKVGFDLSGKLANNNL